MHAHLGHTGGISWIGTAALLFAIAAPVSAPESNEPAHPTDVEPVAVPEQPIVAAGWAPAAAITERPVGDPRWQLDLDWEAAPTGPTASTPSMTVPLELPATDQPIDHSAWFGIERQSQTVEEQLAGYDPWFDRTWNGDPFAVRQFWSVGFRFDSGLQWTMTDITGQVMRFSEFEAGESLEFQFGYQF